MNTQAVIFLLHCVIQYKGMCYANSILGLFCRKNLFC